MPTISLRKNELLMLLGKKIEDDFLGDKLAMLGNDVKEINEDVIHIEVSPNRPDMLSEEGVARALSQFLGIKPGLREYKVNGSDYRFKVEAEAKKLRPYVAVAVIQGINMDECYDSLMELHDKLCVTHGRNRAKVAIGLHDLAKVTFPITFTVRDNKFQFQALQMQEKKTIQEILLVHDKGKEYRHLVEKWKQYPLWIDKKGTVLSMPPIINSEDTKVTRNTRSLVIDVTGTDEKAVQQALAILCCAAADRGGKIYKVNEHPYLEPTKLAFDRGYCNKLLGLQLGESEVKKLLERMGFGYSAGKVLVPAYRADILHQMDLVEDIAIAYGYENFAAEIPKLATIAGENTRIKFQNIVADALVGAGMLEVLNYHLVSEEMQTKRMMIEKEVELVKNQKSTEYQSLRTWLLPGLLDVLRKNLHRAYPQKLFETGEIFENSVEIDKVAGVISESGADYTKVRQTVDFLLRGLGVEGDYKEAEHKSFIPGRVAEIVTHGKVLGLLGELHPQVLENFGIQMPTVAFEFRMDLLEQMTKK